MIFLKALKFPFIAVWLTFFFSACGQSGRPPSSTSNFDPEHLPPPYSSGPFYFSPSGPETTPAERASTATVTCKDPENCHESVGMITGISSEGPYGCTGFLVGPRLVMTNSHCIPDELKTSFPSSCENRIWMSFPRTARLEEHSARCSRVLSASEIRSRTDAQGHHFALGVGPDYALIELAAAVSRPVVTLRHSGIADGESLRVARVNPVNRGEITGEVDTVPCTARQRTYVVPSFSANQAPVIAADGCNIMQGNSGSPILAADGSVVGVAQGILDLRHIQTSNQYLGMPIASEDIAPMMIGTNLACVSLPFEETRTMPPECAQELSSLSRRTIQVTANQCFSSLLGRAEAQASRLSTPFAWTVMKIEKESRGYRVVNDFVLSDIENYSPGTSGLGARDALYSLRPACLRGSRQNSTVRLSIIWEHVFLASHYRLNCEMRQTHASIEARIHINADRNTQFEMTSIANEVEELWSGNLPLCQ